ncbi:helix-turn-helix domain-containing protein, partial [Lactococcus petauri]|uniref:helix-turn-helix domain-containing protein n=1 Tax=Lactococcus petauri TaxID=1940789 RepID=UPI0025502AAD
MLLSPSRKKDLEVLHLLCTSIKVTYSSIASDKKITLRSVKDIVKRLNNAIDESFNIKNFILSNNKGDVYIDPKHTLIKFDILFKLRLIWYKEAPATQLIMTVFSNPNKSYEEISEILFLSEAGLRKVISKTNTYLKLFCFQIKTIKGRLSFVGDEIRIRIFLFNFFTYSYHNIEWPFTSEDLKVVKEYLPPQTLSLLLKQADSQIQSCYIWIHILKNRFSYGMFISSENINLDWSLLNKLHSKENSFLNTLSIFDNVPSALKESEILISELCLRMYIPEIDPEEFQMKLGDFFELGTTNITRLGSILVKELDKFFSQSRTSSTYNSTSLRIYQVTIFILIFQAIGETITPFLYMYFPKPTYHLFTNDSFMKHINQITHKYINKYDKEFQDYIRSFLYSLYRPSLQRPIYIYLEFSKDNAAPYYVQNRIYTIYNESHVAFVSKMENADLI